MTCRGHVRAVGDQSAERALRRIPVSRTRKKHTFVYQDNVCFFQRNKSLTGFVKCTSCVKYASRVKCAAAREGIYFISHCDEGAIFHNSRSELFHIRRKPNISPKAHRNKLRMIYKAYALIYLRKCDIINSPINKNLTKEIS